MSQVPEIGSSAQLPAFARILLATDFSSYSDIAVPFARLLADYYHAELFVGHVIPSDTGDAQSEKAAEAGPLMRHFIEANAVEPIADAIIESGPVWDVLARIIDEKNIDLVVLGTHGRTGVGKLMLGSVAQRIFGSAPCPVLSVGRRARRSWTAERKLATILCPTDFSGDSLMALPYALSLAKVSEAELLLLHAPQPGSAGHTDMHSYHDHLTAMMPADAKEWLRFDTLVIPGDPASVIANAAAERTADLVVMSAGPVEGPLYSLQVPLTTGYQVVARAGCPVLRVRTAAKATGR